MNRICFFALVGAIAWFGRDGIRGKSDLGSPLYPYHCWDSKYQQMASSGKYAHVYCKDENGEVYRDGNRVILRWDGAQIQWEQVPQQQPPRKP